ncbi:hypothetical protein K0651_01940, partial [Ornithinimicrobium sp. Arc0846-15]|nr:hypothetical protein [Ornithinimicrobium laminariae]
MPWLKSGDNAATYPQLLHIAAHPEADDRLVNEVAGFLWRCAMQSAGHMTDYEVDYGTAFLMSPTRALALIDVACWAGLMCSVPDASPPRWVITDDPEFIHIRLRDAVMWERQRDRDRKNPELTMPVRLRDGDACRYCSEVVNFGARSGKRSGTYDHRVAGEAGTHETMVVACRSCNSKRGTADELPLLPAPANPYHSPRTVVELEKHGYNVKSEPTASGRTQARPSDLVSSGSTQARPSDLVSSGSTQARPSDLVSSGSTQAR